MRNSFNKAELHDVEIHGTSVRSMRAALSGRSTTGRFLAKLCGLRHFTQLRDCTLSDVAPDCWKSPRHLSNFAAWAMSLNLLWHAFAELRSCRELQRQKTTPSF